MPKQGFISWSGDESRSVAEALKDFFAVVLPNPTLFVASKDLQAGEVWFTEIAEKLEACDIGVIVVTPQNINKPWLHFEAGALSKRVGRSAAIPLLCGVANGELAGTPLAQLQALTVSEANMRKLTSRLNDLLELGVSEGHIDSTFPVWWERYSNRIADPEIWKGTSPKKAAPTTADLSVQISQVAAAISDLTERVNRAPAPQRIPRQVFDGDLSPRARRYLMERLWEPSQFSDAETNNLLKEYVAGFKKDADEGTRE